MAEMRKVANVPTDVEIELGCRLLDGDQTVLTDILIKYGPAIACVIHPRFPSFREQDVEDVLAIALDRLWKRRATYDDRRSPLRRWFCLIATSVAKDVLKAGWHKARKLEVSTDTEVIEQYLAVGDRPDATSPTLEQAKRERDLSEILRKLPDEQRRIILAWAECDEGAWTTDLAQELEKPAATVRAIRLRVLESVKNELRKRGHSVP